MTKAEFMIEPLTAKAARGSRRRKQHQRNRSRQRHGRGENERLGLYQRIFR